MRKIFKCEQLKYMQNTLYSGKNEIVPIKYDFE